MTIMRRCSFCQKPYDELKPRTQAERETICVALMVSGPAAAEDRAFCDGCYEQIVASPNRRNNSSSLDVGGSNRGPPNVLLQRAYGR